MRACRQVCRPRGCRAEGLSIERFVFEFPLSGLFVHPCAGELISVDGSDVQKFDTSTKLVLLTHMRSHAHAFVPPRLRKLRDQRGALLSSPPWRAPHTLPASFASVSPRRLQLAREHPLSLA